MKDSPAYQMLRVVHDYLRSYRDCTAQWERAMWETLKIALAHNIRFDPDDFHKIEQLDLSRYRTAGVLPGWVVGGPENVYALACAKSVKSDWVNTSACRAVEKYMGRKAYIVDGKRLAIGSEFKWEGVPVKVTSFPGPDELIACAYDPDADYRKVKQRFRIPRRSFKAGTQNR